MQPWIYFLIVGVLFFLMMRGGCGAHVMGHRHGRHASSGSDSGDTERLASPKTAVDPVCGMNVETATAKSSVYSGKPYFFCSPQCRDKFEQAPGSFLKATTDEAQPMEHHHG